MDMYEKGCSKKSHRACAALGRMYEAGQGVDKDMKAALQFYEKSCKLDSEIACNNIGVLYFNEKKYEKAKSWFEKACNLKNGVGCYNTGFLYANGMGVKQDISAMLRLYNRGCELNSIEACAALGELHEKGGNKNEDFRISVFKDTEYAVCCSLYGCISYWP
ncbi:MAG: hypothetical protein CVV37_01865 [Nitrospira bacterium HGW-Nitrospira-1]|nr:MAG: hypothetical protein CVV37_01865 [Nitrospira bacterium HGW-Nitrospira-1]